MKLRELLRKIDDSIRPLHMQGEGPGGNPLLDGPGAGRAGNLHAPSQQDKEAHP